MTRLPGFGVLLARLSDHRELDMTVLSRVAAVPGPELRAVLDGVVPSPSLLRRLAPALNLHTADLFVIAGLAAPDDLAPLDTKAGVIVGELVGYAICLPPKQRRRLRQLVGSLPQEDRTQPAPKLPVYEQYQPGFGALLVRMLRNRNLGWVRSAMILRRLTGLYLSPATIGAVGHGRKELSPELLAGFAAVLAIPADDLAALTGVELPDSTLPANPAAADVAELIWDVRRLTADQVRQVCDHAKSIQQLEPKAGPYDPDYSRNDLGARRDGDVCSPS